MRGTGEAEALLGLLEKIYGTIAGERTIEEALIGLADFVGAAGMILHRVRHHPDGVSPPDVAVNHGRIDPAGIAIYLRDFIQLDARWPYARALDDNSCFADSDVLSDTQMGRMPFYVDLLAKHGLRYGLIACPRNDRQALIGFTAQYTIQHGPPRERERRRMLLAMPHFRRVLALEQSFEGLTRQVELLDVTMDRLGTPVLALARDGRIVHANRAAERLLVELPEITIRAGRLEIRNAAAARQLSRSLVGLVSTNGAAPSVPPPILIPRSPPSPPLTIVLSLLAGEMVKRSEAIAIATLSDGAGVGNDAGPLGKLFELTAAETALVTALANGTRLKDYAARKRISYETVRTHLRRIFDKTNTQRQQDLIRLALDVMQPTTLLRE